MQNNNVILDHQKILETIKTSPYKTIGNLANALKIHRNTISDYLRGKTPVILPIFCEILNALSLKAEDVFITQNDDSLNIEPIDQLIETLFLAMPTASFFIFGSRSRGDNREFSDYDIGVYRKSGITGKEFSKLHILVLDWNDNNMTTAQLTNFNNADKNFLLEIAPDLKFLAGSFASKNEINKLLIFDKAQL